MINKKLVKNRFKKSLTTYEKSAVVQKRMAEYLVKKLIDLDIKKIDEVFEFGTGTGFLTKAVKEKISFNKYSANDIIEQSKIYIEKVTNVQDFYAGDIENIELKNQYDLIVSNAVMQWITDIEGIFEKVKKIMKKDSVFAFTTFGENNFIEIKETTGLSLEYLKQETLLQKCEKYFDILYFEETQETLFFKNPIEVLKHIKETGTNGISRLKWTQKKLKEFTEFYEKSFALGDNVKLTYNPVYVVLKQKID